MAVPLKRGVEGAEVDLPLALFYVKNASLE
jgi:hypothetical protein